MESLTAHVLAAFQSHWPRLRADPAELAARLQRRRRAELQRPPRAWCVALRANDTRLTPFDTIIDDPHAPAARRPHTVTIDAALVRRLVAPVEVHPLGQTPHEIAALLGVTVRNLRNAVDAGVFARRRIPRLGGKRGRPQPLLTCPHPLDPAGPLYRPPAGYWGHAWKRHGDNFPDDHVQPVERRPHFRPTIGRQTERNSTPKTGSGGTGWYANLCVRTDDTGWRTNLCHPESVKSDTETASGFVKDDDADETRPGRFHDWHWTCPACRRGVRKIYFPLPVPNVETHLNLRLAPPGHRLHEADAPPAPVPTFACEDCHRLTHIDDRSYKGWNALVTHLTCGLLYGHEVPRPPEWPYELPPQFEKPTARGRRIAS